MIIKLQYEFGVLEIHDNYVKAIMDEGVTVSPKHNKSLVEISESYFANRKFGYITHRINSYSVDPRVYLKTSKIPNLVAFAIVSNNPVNLSNAQVEKLFLDKPFKTFKNLDKAIKWVKEVVNSESEYNTTEK